MQPNLVRLCPQCRGERPIEELVCEGEWNGAVCGWSLTDITFSTQGESVTATVLEQPEVGVLTESENDLRCANGHRLAPGDLLCIECGSPVGDRDTPASTATIIDGWKLLRPLPARAKQIDRFLAESVDNPDGSRCVINMLSNNIAPPDNSLYQLLQKTQNPHLCRLVAFGSTDSAHYEVWEETSESTLEDLIQLDRTNNSSVVTVRSLTETLGPVIDELSRLGIRHRDIRPSNVLVLSHEPLDLQLAGLTCAIQSQFDLDLASPPQQNWYTAPEAVTGGVTASSDWWSLGIILLDIATSGQCFADVNENAFLIHMVTRGIEIPSSIDEATATLLAGLLTKDPHSRWNWEQVQKWLAGEIQERSRPQAPPPIEQGGPLIMLGTSSFWDPSNFALAAAQVDQWEEACSLLARGVISTWLEDRKADARMIATVRAIAADNELSDDFKMGLTLLAMNQNMPLSFRGEIVNPAWLLAHPTEGYELITGPAAVRLEQMEREPQLLKLRDRAAIVAKRIETYEITPDETILHVALLSTSRRNLEERWSAVRKMFPDSSHPGILKLLDKRTPTDEDLIILISSPITDFIPASEVLEKATAAARKAGLFDFKTEQAAALLALPRADISKAVEQRTENFARCGNEVLDSWADTIRLDKRIDLDRALVLASVPKEKWKQPEKQEYVQRILGFFERKIMATVLRGPLVSQRISRTTPAIDLMEVGTTTRTAYQILDHLLARTGNTIELDPQRLEEEPPLDSRVRRLVQRTKTFSRDTGRHGLFLGFPYIVYRTKRGDDAKATLRVAPLILWPVKIETTLAAYGSVKLAFEKQQEEARLNPALEGVLNLDQRQGQKWIQCADDILKLPMLTVKEVLEGFAQLAEIPSKELSRLPGKEVESSVEPGKFFITPSAVLFNCDFSGKSIADDLRHIIQRPLNGTALERLLKIAGEAKLRAQEHHIDLIDNYCVIDSDPSQLEAIGRARGQAGLHIEGPPGTGKSQTIVNIIADCLAQRQTVLVVCQKQAALNIVEKRLNAEGLGNRLFFITDLTKDRVPIIRALRGQIERGFNRKALRREQLQSDRIKLVARLRKLEADLDSHHKSIHITHSNSGLTYRNIINQLIGIERTYQFFPAPEIRSGLNNFDDAALTLVEDECAGIAQLWLNSNYEKSPLQVMKALLLDDGVANHIARGFTTFLDAEEARRETFSPMGYGDCVDMDDVTELEVWLNEHYDSFAAYSPELFENLASWQAQFPIGFDENSSGSGLLNALGQAETKLQQFDQTHHVQDLFELLRAVPTTRLATLLESAEAACEPENSRARIKARWDVLRFLQESRVTTVADDGLNDEAQKAFAAFLAAEQARCNVFDRYPDSFDIEDASAADGWLKEHEQYFQNLQDVHRRNIVAWIDFFAPGAAGESKGSEIISSLARISAGLAKLEGSDHEPALFPLLSQLTVSTLGEWLQRASTATASTDPFLDPGERLVARWQIARFLCESGVSKITDDQLASADLKESFAEYVRLETDRVNCLERYPNSFDIEDDKLMKSWLVANESFFKSMSDSTRRDLAQWLDKFGPSLDTSKGSQSINELSGLVRELDQLDSSAHKDELFAALCALPRSSLDSWIAIASRAINPGGLFGPLSLSRLIARWQMSQHLKQLGVEPSDRWMLNFLKAAELEKQVSPIRYQFASIAAMFRQDKRGLTKLSLGELDKQMRDLLEALQTVADAVQRIQACPAQQFAISFVKAADVVAFEAFARNATGAIAVFQARARCKDCLSKLTQWFQLDWISRQSELIASENNDVPDLKSTWNAIPFFNDFTIDKFSRAAKLEASLEFLRRDWTATSQTLKITIDQSTKQTLQQLSEEVNEALANTKQVSSSCDRVYSADFASPCIVALKQGDVDAFNAFAQLLRGAIERCRFRDFSRVALNNLTDWFGEQWLADQSVCINRNENNLAELKDIERVLPLLNDAAMNKFKLAAQLEYAIAPIRAELNSIASALKLSRPNPNSQTLKNLSECVTATLHSLRKVANSIKILDSCPLSDQARKFARSGTRESFDYFVRKIKGAIERQHARTRSSNALTNLEEWFTSEWISAQLVLIANGRDNVGKLKQIHEELPALETFQQFRLRSKTLNKHTLSVLSSLQGQRPSMRSIPPDNLPIMVRQTVRREACLNWKGQMELEDASLTISNDELNRKINAVAEANSELAALNRNILGEPGAEGIAHQDDWEDLTRMTGPRTRRLREIIERGSELGLMRIRPIWLMNPEVASRVLPLKPGLFDKVIFDEASQLPVEYALPTLFRARQAIVSGDDKQMPPTSFFASKIGSDEDAEDYDENDDQVTEAERNELQERWNRKEIKDCPDLLELAKNVLPSRRLEIHYRSAYRELIAFSNAAFYENSLNVPARHPRNEVLKARPIEVERVDAPYTERTNLGEARKIVEILKSYWSKQSGRPTVGVVSFNRDQADLIAKLVDEYAQKDSSFAAALQDEELREEDGEDMGFFIKNLENVQGDERDIIIFSTTFGRDSRNKFIRNFGKLGQDGGERRLNVAVTRAKQKIILVTSLPISDIASAVPAGKMPTIPRDYLQYYLDYATKLSEGRIEQAYATLDKLCRTNGGKVSTTSNADYFIADVEAFIRELGYEAVVTAEDQSAFSVDVAIVHPKTGLFAVGIECDAPTHHLLKTGYHREVWRKSVLTKSIRTIHRITSRDWYQDKQRQQNKLKKIVAETIQA